MPTLPSLDERAPVRASGTVSGQNLAVAVGKNTMFGVIANIAQVITRLVTVPMVISHLGLDGYGIWSIIMTAEAYMRFGAAGLKSAFQKYVAEAVGNGDFTRVNQLIATGSAAILGLSVMGLVPVFLFAEQLARIAGVPQQFVQSTAGALGLLAIIMIISNFAAAYEAILMGANRIDLVKKFTVVLSCLEAVAIVVFLHFGSGLLAMTAVMAASELALAACCYLYSSRVLPQVRVNFRLISGSVVRELVRFAGSYQLLSVLEVIYVAVLPVTILKLFGAEASGLYALCTRLVIAASLFQESSMLPLLSGGAMVYASGTGRQLQSLLAQAFKWSLVLTLPPLVFLCLFGNRIIHAWTGQTNSLFQPALWMLCSAALFRSLGRAAFVLYRASGGASMDVFRQLIALVTVVFIALIGHPLGYIGVLAGMAFAELIGMLFMLVALNRAISVFDARRLLPENARLLAAICAAFIVSLVAGYPWVEWSINSRLNALIQVGLGSAGCLIAFWPIVTFARVLSAEERHAIGAVLFRTRRSALVEADPSI